MLNKNEGILQNAFGKQKRWVTWKYKEIEGKQTKIPYQLNGAKASSTNPETWSAYEDLEDLPNIGIVFTPDQLLLGIDIDHCLEGNEIVHPEKEKIEEFIKQANTYTEISPSNTGLHLYLSLTEPLQLVQHKKAPFEIYTSGRYFTVTNNSYQQIRDVRTVSLEEASALLAVIGYPWNKKDTQNTTVSKDRFLDDSTILSRMFESKVGNKIKSLYEGNISLYNNDDSSADMALCAHLAYWTAKDASQIERIWLNSPLGARGKTQERKDYRDRTIRAAIEGCLDIYSPRVEASSKNNEKAQIDQDKFKFVSLGDLLNEPEELISWVVEDLLPAGGLSIVVAKPKVGKSTFVRQLALAVARGESFLDRNTVKGRVLYVALEEKRSEVRIHFKLLGADGTEDLGVHVGSAPLEANRWLEEEIKKQLPILIIIDTLFRFVRVGDVSDYAKITTALDPLLNLSREYGTHLMVLHHARKMDGEGADTTLGSTAIFGTVDTAIILKRIKDGKRTIETQQRYGNDIEETMLVFHADAKAISLGGSKDEDDTHRIKEAIIEFLKSIKTPVPEDEIDVEGKTMFKRKGLRELVKENKIERTGKGKKGNPFLYSCFPVPTIYEEQETDSAHPENSVDLDEFVDSLRKESLDF